jgi:aspartyl-tRNA(Asn)/glutamyl-tRNA(Gln) amidotransferase subunit B
MFSDYEPVIGLEVHMELKTDTKIFCGCKTAFGAPPNTQCCPVCMGMPGTLPVLNKKVVEYAIKAGLATGCRISSFSKQDRKNYFYPDLPKAYQISQYDLPLCENGGVDIETPSGVKRIGITRIHIEEDAGKLIHDAKHGTMIDCNRCGVPLIEIVSEPDLRSPDEAVAYLKKMRAVILYTGVSDCKMNEGSMRCDVNLSVRKKGENVLNTRTEMKNINSFVFVAKAIEYEFRRQVEAVENGETIIQETRRFDEATGKTFPMRSKENANDYRYFPDPDLPPIVTDSVMLSRLKSEIPALPDERKRRYIGEYGLTPLDAELLTTERAVADWFETAAKMTRYPKLAANFAISEVIKLVPPDGGEVPVSAKGMASVCDLAGDGKINAGTAKQLIKELSRGVVDPVRLVEERGLYQINDEALLSKLVAEAMAENPKSVADYKKGKTAAAKAIIGQTIAKTDGLGNPELIQRLVMKALGEPAK